MKVEIYINGKKVSDKHFPKSIDIVYKIREGRLVKIVRSVVEEP